MVAKTCSVEDGGGRRQGDHPGAGVWQREEGADSRAILEQEVRGRVIYGFKPE